MAIEKRAPGFLKVNVRREGYRNPLNIKANVGWWHPGKGQAQRPHFGVTLDLKDARTGSDEGGGAAHELFAELWPEFAHLVRWHLWDDNGNTMHGNANGIYFAQEALGLSEFNPKQDNKTPEALLETFKNVVAFGAVDGETLPAWGERWTGTHGYDLVGIGGTAFHAAHDEKAADPRGYRATLAKINKMAEDGCSEERHRGGSLLRIIHETAQAAAAERIAHARREVVEAEAAAWKARRAEVARIVGAWLNARQAAVAARMLAETTAVVPLIPESDWKGEA